MIRAPSLVVLAVACRTAHGAPPPTTIGSFAVSDLACSAPHKLAIVLDGTAAGTIAAPCKPPPVHHGSVVITDSAPAMGDGPAIAITRGHHTLSVSDPETGKSDHVSFTWPLRGTARNPDPKQLAADTLVISVDKDRLSIDVALRANVVVL